MALTFAGIQKLTLIDYPDKPACTLFTAGCNFACPFCHNPELIAEHGDGSHVQYFDFLESRIGFIDAVCISGGEPLINKDIPIFIDKVKELGYLVKIDTNGSNPKMLRELAASGRIDYVAMDIKNTFEKYPQTVGVQGFDTSPIKESIEYLLSGAVPYEFRTTVVRDFHTPDDIVSIAHMINGADKYFLQSFENADRALKPGLSSYSIEEMQDILEKAKQVIPYVVLRG